MSTLIFTRIPSMKRAEAHNLPITINPGISGMVWDFVTFTSTTVIESTPTLPMVL
jgi:hypothetical protein